MIIFVFFGLSWTASLVNEFKHPFSISLDVLESFAVVLLSAYAGYSGLTDLIQAPEDTHTTAVHVGILVFIPLQAYSRQLNGYAANEAQEIYSLLAAMLCFVAALSPHLPLPIHATICGGFLVCALLYIAEDSWNSNVASK